MPHLIGYFGIYCTNTAACLKYLIMILLIVVFSLQPMLTNFSSTHSEHNTYLEFIIFDVFICFVAAFSVNESLHEMKTILEYDIADARDQHSMWSIMPYSVLVAQSTKCPPMTKRISPKITQSAVRLYRPFPLCLYDDMHLIFVFFCRSEWN